MARCTFRIPFQGWKNCIWNCKTSWLQASTWSQIKRWNCDHIFFLLVRLVVCVVTVTCDQQFQWNIVTSINEQKVRPITKASPIVIAKMREKIINLSGIFSNNCLTWKMWGWSLSKFNKISIFESKKAVNTIIVHYRKNWSTGQNFNFTENDLPEE